ncbi:hypothetical protein GW17_00046370 [Ensete ventricosum]|nr:hypothetical protein GW17_00046370 [Ensete ventricosum]
MADVDLAATSSCPRTIVPPTWPTRCGKSVWRRYGGVSGHTADLTQVRSTPLTCRCTSHRKDGGHGGEVRQHGGYASRPLNGLLVLPLGRFRSHRLPLRRLLRSHSSCLQYGALALSYL